MSMAIGSAMKEDLELERKRFEDSPLAVGSAMKEDIERDSKEHTAFAISPTMKAELRKG